MSVYRLHELQKKMSKCTHDFSCLANGLCGNPPQCKILSKFDTNMLYAEPANSQEVPMCPFKMTYSSQRYLCTCPIHYYIYEQSTQGDHAAYCKSNKSVVRL
jgi:hypothetical protein